MHIVDCCVSFAFFGKNGSLYNVLSQQMAKNACYTQSTDKHSSKWFHEQPGMSLQRSNGATFQGRNFKSAVFRDMCEVFGIRRHERRRFNHKST